MKKVAAIVMLALLVGCGGDKVLYTKDIPIFDVDSNLVATVQFVHREHGDSWITLDSKLNSNGNYLALQWAQGLRGHRYYVIDSVVRYGAFVAGESTVTGAETREAAKLALKMVCKTASKDLLGHVQWGDFKACVDMNEISPYTDTVHTLCGQDTLKVVKKVWYNVGAGWCRHNAPIKEEWRE